MRVFPTFSSVWVLWLILFSMNCSGGTGGARLWKMKVLAGNPPYVSIAAVGDDGVVVVRAGDQIMEIAPTLSGEPVVTPSALTGIPFARVAGSTFAWPPGGGPVVSWAATGALPVSAGLRSDDVARPEVAICKNGEVYCSTRFRHRPHLTKFSADGQVVFERTFGTLGSSAGRVRIGVDGTVFVETSLNHLFAFSDSGDFLWSNDQTQAVFMPAADGGVVVLDEWNRMVHLSSGGFPDFILNATYGTGFTFALTPGDMFVPRLPSVLSVQIVAALADGGTVVYGDPFAGDAISRLSTTGNLLWRRKIPQANYPPFIGNGIYYALEFLTDSTGTGVWLSAFDLGAPLADSAWPTSVGWPDGSNRARARTYSPPFVTMLHSSPRSGVVLDFGTDPGQRYYVEWSNDLSGTWKSSGLIAGTPWGVQYHDTAAGSDSMRVYRVRLWL